MSINKHKCGIQAPAINRKIKKVVSIQSVQTFFIHTTIGGGGGIGVSDNIKNLVFLWLILSHKIIQFFRQIKVSLFFLSGTRTTKVE